MVGKRLLKMSKKRKTMGKREIEVIGRGGGRKKKRKSGKILGSVGK